MHASGTVTESLPDWYLIERETEKTIEKLNSARELEYYINNADEYLRRLALLRLKKLSLNQSGEKLREIMDDPAESHANKYLAAWALKSLLVESDPDYMLNSRYLANFTGYEKYEELFPVILGDDVCDIMFRFSSSPGYAAFQIDDEDSVIEKDIVFRLDFDFRQWVSDFGSSLKANIKNLPVSILKLLNAAAARLLHCVKTAAGSLAKSIDRMPDQAAEKNAHAKRKHKASKPGNKALPFPSEDILGTRLQGRNRSLHSRDYLDDYSRIRNEIYGRSGFLSCVKKGVFQLFYFLFYPIRFARRHKFAFLCILLSSYIFFVYFSYGRAITSKYAGFDLQEVQSGLLEKAGTLYSQVIDELNKLIGMDEWKENRNSGTASGDILKTNDVGPKNAEKQEDENISYIVSAKDGLNIRTAPDPSSARVGSTALPYRTRVTYITSAFSESAGIEWFYVRADDGRVGWVSSKYLRKEEDQ